MNVANLDLKNLQSFKMELTRFMMTYKFALDEMETKIKILQEEFEYVHEHNPIEHIKCRLKSPESIFHKVLRKNYPLSLSSIKTHIKDIAGIRITCSFLSDIYTLSEMLQNQSDIRVLEVKDYIKHPKANGYQSLHLILELPVFMTDRTEHVCMEVQIRTIAMDFWASLEHKIYYKYDAEVPDHLLRELKDAADSAAALDRKMEGIHHEIDNLKKRKEIQDESQFKQLTIQDQTFELPEDLLKLLETEEE
ncbi:GTP pyrophosphokinase [Alkalicoccobacillus porphyridii]|uniref:GTP pyrophosphokinase family protein n=1 Tax=Alkalicoccobacillus porphyridii TaxID=2597270 RepID=A0A553ZXN4_9BACI|nr:GTP pyrophosphokinase family protein [Alkalicoccobacillus porphyridii]TSB46116.1 GTP pyrophosphokinase family protein [Alkalicoccobacillus porphyridii]